MGGQRPAQKKGQDYRVIKKILWGSLKGFKSAGESGKGWNSCTKGSGKKVGEADFKEKDGGVKERIQKKKSR